MLSSWTKSRQFNTRSDYELCNKWNNELYNKSNINVGKNAQLCSKLGSTQDKRWLYGPQATQPIPTLRLTSRFQVRLPLPLVRHFCPVYIWAKFTCTVRRGSTTTAPHVRVTIPPLGVIWRVANYCRVPHQSKLRVNAARNVHFVSKYLFLS